MSAELTKDMTKEEESLLYTRFVMCEKGIRFLLMEAFERKAHKAIGISNFEDYCRERLSLSHDASYLSRLVSAARVERQVSGESFNSLKLLDGEKSRISFKAASEIAKLPEEKWQRVYEEYCERDSGRRTPGELQTELKRIVKREMNADAMPAPTPTLPVEPPKPRANMTPIVPPTYDRGPEYDDEPAEEVPSYHITTSDCAKNAPLIVIPPELEVVEPDFEEPRTIASMAQEQRASINLPSTDAAISLLRRYARDGHSDPLWCDVCDFLKGLPA